MQDGVCGFDSVVVGEGRFERDEVVAHVSKVG